MEESFSHYTIKHFYINKPDEEILPGNKYFLVIWFQSIAIGHIWIEDSNEIAFRSLVVSIVEEWLSRKNIESENWKVNLSQGDYTSLCTVFERLVSQTELAKNQSIAYR